MKVLNIPSFFLLLACIANQIIPSDGFTHLSKAATSLIGEHRATVQSITASAIGWSTAASLAIAEAAPGGELVELPPPYVPVLFAVVILGGVGVLTGSLGDVIADEASLGNLSGAKAKKEMERSRSSFFGKKK